MEGPSRLPALSPFAGLRLLVARSALALLVAWSAPTLLVACGSEADPGRSAGGGGSGDPDAAALAQRGRQVYEINCIACHNPDPAKDGAVGPAVADSSLELLAAKVLRNEYPPGYVPKRTTGNMVPLPHLEKDLPALAAHLAR